MSDDSELFQVVRDSMWSLLSDRYRTNRRARGAQTEDEFLHERTFWPAFTFEGVQYAAEDGTDRLLVTFHDTDAPEITIGFRIDLVKAMAEWSKRVGGRDPREHPRMFAAELIWFMVCFIGVADFDDASGTPDAPHWINDGSEIFGKLRNNPNMDAFESHH
ncbi:hypothetical protein [Streptomyces albipurpureus]|uniref:Uncharacterized protein n=1 Tax=Streptomyces albipurpureus TaxID=2897419 RepID=A0ABT0UHM9_9ACTN|nr:hypothetical protein [Streptomyces sp. CWNU-1]MCM2388153.1 hypothetical protein [Streptomyces sp. CWNU-1]